MLTASLVCLVGLISATVVLLRSSSRATSNEAAVREAVASQVADRQKKVQQLDDAVVQRLAETEDPIDDVIREYQPTRAKLCPPGMERDGPTWAWTDEDSTSWKQQELARMRKTAASGENFKTMMQIVVILTVSGIAALFLYRDAASQSPPMTSTPVPVGKLPAVFPTRP